MMLDFRLKSKGRAPNTDFTGRRKFLFRMILAGMVILTGRAFYLQAIHDYEPQQEKLYKHVHDETISANRGMITDRNGEPLAVSTPVERVVIDAKELKEDDENSIKQKEKAFLKHKRELAGKEKGEKLTDAEKLQALNDYRLEKSQKIQQIENILSLPPGEISKLAKEEKPRRFVRLAQRMPPELAEQVRSIKLFGVHFEREFKRFYPTSEISGHLLGFTDADEIGREGLEAGFEQTLKGKPGKKRVICDGQGNVIEDVSIKEAINGRNITLSIDERLQYLAYRELQRGVEENKAQSGVLVILDAKTGELLAAVNQPAFNPNAKEKTSFRNRAITDVFEPGSTIKPFVVAAGLDGGYVKPHDLFVTNGSFSIGHRTVKDVHNYGTLDLTHVLKKSSNIAVSQMALRMPAKYFWGVYRDLGFGVSANSGFPGEADGRLIDYQRLNDFGKATLSFGYGVSTSALQLARAYTALADDGILHSVSLVKRDEGEEDVNAKRVFTKKTARSVRAMMEHVIMKDGTAYEARVDGYTVAGKTGTVKKSVGRSGYAAGKYFSVFAGIAPAKDPRLVMVVMIDEPSAGQYYGGLVSAPVFSRVMNGALRILDVAPDQIDTMPILLTQNCTKGC